MGLVESIASYSGESRRKIEQLLTPDVKDVILRIVRDPGFAQRVNPALIAELIDLSVFCREGTELRPSTAIFLQEDFETIAPSVYSIAAQMARVLITEGADLKSASPYARNFIGGIMGLGQGLGAGLRRLSLAQSWRDKPGKYARSKVDFNEDCLSLRSFGEDLQVKRTHKGSGFTCVVIGPGRNDYVSRLLRLARVSTEAGAREISEALVAHLTDSIPRLALGLASDESLVRVASLFHIDPADRSCVLTGDDAARYAPLIARISDAATQCFMKSLGQVERALSLTVAGRRGAPTATMMMNYWRFARRATARELYSNGFFTDRVPQDGFITLFYDNDAAIFDE